MGTWRLTRVEHHFADDDPSRGEVQVQLEQAAAPPVETDRDVPGVLQHQVRYVGVRQRLVLVGLAVGAEPYVRLGEHLRREGDLETVTTASKAVISAGTFLIRGSACLLPGGGSRTNVRIICTQGIDIRREKLYAKRRYI